MFAIPNLCWKKMPTAAALLRKNPSIQLAWKIIENWKATLKANPKAYTRKKELKFLYALEVVHGKMATISHAPLKHQAKWVADAFTNDMPMPELLRKTKSAWQGYATMGTLPKRIWHT